MKRFLILFFSVAFISGCDSKPDAPFGFKWGQTVKQTLSQKLKNAELDGDQDVLEFIHADSAPEPVQYQGRYFLAFEPGLGLTSASFSTNVDEGSAFFNQGRAIYSQISKKLEEKYGSPEKIDEKVDRDGLEFYSCIKEDGCGKWERTYQHDGMKIVLSVEPTPGRLMDGFSKGSINVRYEYFTEKMKNQVMKKLEKESNSNNF